MVSSASPSCKRLWGAAVPPIQDAMGKPLLKKYKQGLQELFFRKVHLSGNLGTGKALQPPRAGKEEQASPLEWLKFSLPRVNSWKYDVSSG